MKNRVNQILLAVTIVTAVLYAVLLLIWLGIIPRPFYDPADPFRFYELWVYLGVGFHVVPCFFLQLLVCRTAKSPAARLIPIYLLLGIAALFAMFFFTATGWDTLGWGILLLLCAAPAVGYALAWAVFGARWAVRKAKAARHDNH